jgi:hypothetical protein
MPLGYPRTTNRREETKGIERRRAKLPDVHQIKGFSLGLLQTKDIKPLSITLSLTESYFLEELIPLIFQQRTFHDLKLDLLSIKTRKVIEDMQVQYD